MQLKTLKKFGLTENEVKVYQILLELGRAKADEISKKTKINIRNVYDSLNRIIEKGLAGYVLIDNKRNFIPADPERLMKRLDEEEEELEEILPMLMHQFKSKRAEGKVKFFTGKKGIRTILSDQIKEKKEVLVMGGKPLAREIIGSYIDRYTRERIENKIKLKIIFNKKQDYHKKIPLCNSRYLPKNVTIPAATNIYGEKVAIILWSEDPIVVLIEKPEIAESYKKNFELMWKVSTK